MVQSVDGAPKPRGVPAVKAFGDFIKSVRYEDLPPSVQAGSKARLLNAVGAAFASRNTPWSRLALSYTSGFGATGHAVCRGTESGRATE